MKLLIGRLITVASFCVCSYANASLVSCTEADASQTVTRNDNNFLTICYGNSGTDFIFEGQGPAGVTQLVYNSTYGGSENTFKSYFEQSFIDEYFGFGLSPDYVVLENGFNSDGSFLFRGSVLPEFKIEGFLTGRNGVTDTVFGGSLDTVYEDSVILNIVERMTVNATTPSVLTLLLIACTALMSGRTARV